MFRWLKDRSKKSRKPSPSGSQRSKEDDYGFKQLQQKQQQQQQQPQGDIYKRDLPPTPADLMTSSHDDDRSLHIYEEIPDLPFRCTPEGELRITLAREQARKHTPPPNPPPGSGYGIRNISPYMVVPLEKVRETPSEFRSGFPQRGETSFPKAAGAGGGPGAGRDSASPGSCCGSSVFGSPFAAAGGCGTAGGDLGGDISDRLLNAINLTRLLAAVRLSSSSADTCTTSPICIGVDKDGRNISVSVSVTPTTPTPNSHHHNDDADNKGVEEPSRGNTTTTTTTTRNPATSLHNDTVGNTTTTTTTARNPPTTLHNDTVPEVVPPAPTLVSQSGLTSGSAPEADRGPPSQDGQPSGFRLVPSPTEQSAIWEVLQLKPGESTELDPPTIDALILKLCSHTLQADNGSLLGGGEGGGQLHSRQLQELEDMLRELVRTGEGESDPHHPSHPSSSSSSTLPHPSTTTTTTTASSSASSLPHPSPAVRRAENSDTGFEYDVSTSSESDQTSYDYFLSKVARTRSLECEVKKLIHSSGSGEEDDEDEEDDREEEEEEGEGESFSTVSTISPATSHPPPSPEADVTGESDDGTMADLSESENSSGYYETTTTAATTTTTATSTADTTQSTTRSPRGSEQACGQSRPSPHLSDDLDVPCYELDCRDGSGGLVVGTTDGRLDSAQLYSHICDASGVTRSSKGKSGAGKKSRHHHHHHHHHHHQHHSHHKSGGERRTNCTEGGGANAKDVYEGATSAHSRRFSLREGDLAPSHKDGHPHSLDLRRGSADAATGSAKHPTPLLHPHKGHSKPKPKPKPKPASDYSYPFLHSSSSSSSKPRSRSRTRHKPHHPHLERSSSFHSRHSLSDDIYDSRRQNSEVYSIPAALPDPSPAGPGGAGAEARGLKGSVSVPGKLSATARQVRESSEVYGTRAGLERCHNRLLSDLIMLNYNRQVLNM